MLGEPLRLAYGASEIEGLDVFRSHAPNAPINVYIHGGAWRNGRSAEFAFLAELFVNAGAHCVILDFTNIDDVGGNLMTMARQVRSAVAWVYKNAASSAAIRAGSMSAAIPRAGISPAGWSRPTGTRTSACRRTSSRAALLALGHVRLEAGAALEALEIRQVHRRDRAGALSRSAISTGSLARSIVAYGTFETPEFQRQARDFAAAVKAAGKPVSSWSARATITSRCWRRWPALWLLGRAVLEQMKLS